MGHDIAQFGRLSGIRDQDHQVARHDHAQVAMARLRRMHEGRRRSGRGEGRADLARDMPGFADAAEDDPPVVARIASTAAPKSFGQGLGQPQHGLTLDPQDAGGGVARRSGPGASVACRFAHARPIQDGFRLGERPGGWQERGRQQQDDP
jgi:hypothetical protein